jgi:multiple sugar transport system substrate-binding protein
MKPTHKAAAAVTAGVLVLAACGSDDGNADDPGTGDGGGVEKITLTVGSWDQRTAGMEAYYDVVFEQFEADHPGVTIERVDVPPADYSTALTPELSAGQGPDLLMVWPQEYSVWVDNGWLLPIDEYFDASDLPSRIEDNLLELAVKDGQRYGIVAESAPQLLHVNMRLLEEAGIDEVPTTVEDFHAAAAAIKEETGEWGYVPYLDPTADMFMYRAAAQWALGFGSDFGEPGTVTVNTPEIAEAFEWLARFVDEGIAPLGIAETDGRQLFYEGKAGMAIDGPWLAADASENNPDLYPDVHVALVPFPTRDSLTGGAFRAVNATTDHPELAWELLEEMFTPEAQEIFVDMRLRPGGTTDMPDEDVLLERAAWWPNLMEAANNHVVQLGYVPPGFEEKEAEFRQKLAPHLVEIFSGQVPVAEGLAAAQADLEDWADGQGLID